MPLKCLCQEFYQLSFGKNLVVTRHTELTYLNSKDRHERDFILGPTHEETFTKIIQRRDQDIQKVTVEVVSDPNEVSR